MEEITIFWLTSYLSTVATFKVLCKGKDCDPSSMRHSSFSPPDVNECSSGNVCRSEEVCLNTRGGYRCNRISCPPNYERDDAHRK